MENAVVDFAVDVFRIDQQTIHIKDVGADCREGSVAGLHLRHDEIEGFAALLSNLADITYNTFKAL